MYEIEDSGCQQETKSVCFGDEQTIHVNCMLSSKHGNGVWLPLVAPTAH